MVNVNRHPRGMFCRICDGPTVFYVSRVGHVRNDRIYVHPDTGEILVRDEDVEGKTDWSETCDRDEYRAFCEKCRVWTTIPYHRPKSFPDAKGYTEEEIQAIHEQEMQEGYEESRKQNTCRSCGGYTSENCTCKDGGDFPYQDEPTDDENEGLDGIPW